MAESNNGGNNAAGATIQLDTMSLEQLDQLKQREENRLQACTQRFAALRQAAARLSASASAVTELYDKVDDKGKDKEKLPQNEETPVSEDATVDTGGCKEVFVPLTESVYIPGKIQTSDTALLVELGTGYFVERNPSQTVEFLQRKMTVVNANSENGSLEKVCVCITAFV